jgi:16S rRNA (cytidine1402-2'-O)-methyltransferase
MPGTLYLVPSLLGDTAPLETLPAASLAVLRRLDHLVVETPKQARRYLKAAGIALAGQAPAIEVLDEHTPDTRLPELLAPALTGRDMGVVSDAGCPAIADPGARLVRLAHEHGIRVAPLVGPSSILLALMASGMNGQRFVFHGYLPAETKRRDEALRALERDARRLDQAQIAIEAPYRNNRLLQAILATCEADSLLCLATDLTLTSESIVTRSIAQWRCGCPDIDRRPTVFVLGVAARGRGSGQARDPREAGRSKPAA